MAIIVGNQGEGQFLCSVLMIFGKKKVNETCFSLQLHDIKGKTNTTWKEHFSSWKEHSVHNTLMVVNEPKPTEIPLDSKQTQLLIRS